MNKKGEVNMDEMEEEEEAVRKIEERRCYKIR